MKKIIPFVFIVIILSACKIFNPQRMLRAPVNYKFAEAVDSLDQYILGVNDILSFQLYSNKGFQLIDLSGGEGGTSGSLSGGNRGLSDYLIEFDGTVKLPVFGRTKLAGLTLREAEKLLEDMFSEYYKNPFAKLKVTNHRVTIFPGGEGGTAQVITLDNPNIRLFEAIARAGGIREGKSHRVKLIRGGVKDPIIFLMDLSTLEGVKRSNIVLQANDIIYIDPLDRYARKLATSIAPYLTIVTSVLLVISLTNRF